jgi:uncharacterized protein (TIGR03382 family)
MGGPALAESPPMLRRATLLLLLLPGFALGQTVGGTVTASVATQGSSGQANRAECKSTTSTATWNIVATGVTISTGDKWRLATASATGCGTTVPTTFIQDQLATGATQSIPGVFVQPMATEGGVSSCDQANDVQVVLCAYYLPGGLAPTTVQVVQGTFNFQLAVPPAPNITGVSPGDGQLTVAVTPGTTTATETATSGVTYTVTCTPPTGGAGVSVNGNAGNVVCSGLTNGVAYTITAAGKSAANNPGATSAAFGPNSSTTPLPFLSFWDIYKNDGGVDAGGCGTGGAGALAPALALLALLAARRRRS